MRTQNALSLILFFIKKIKRTAHHLLARVLILALLPLLLPLRLRLGILDDGHRRVDLDLQACINSM